MIVFVTSQHHGGTLRPLLRGAFGVKLPPIRQMAYEALWGAPTVPRATYILTDIERLSAWERLLAAEFFTALRDAGLRVLNNPARVLTRHALLLALHEAGLNPFRAWRAEDRPRPARFPVFLRQEADHKRPIGGLIDDQAALDTMLAGLVARGTPLAGLLAVEFCAEPIAPGVWRKMGTFRLGALVTTDHAVIEDDWCVKYGTKGLSTDAMIETEHREVAANAFAAALAPVFDIAGIEYGRADHATVGGREVVYEINTNPAFTPDGPQRFALREETLRIARRRFADGLAGLDGAQGGEVAIETGPRTRKHVEMSGQGAVMAWRP